MVEHLSLLTDHMCERSTVDVRGTRGKPDIRSGPVRSGSVRVVHPKWAIVGPTVDVSFIHSFIDNDVYDRVITGQSDNSNMKELYW